MKRAVLALKEDAEVARLVGITTSMAEPGAEVRVVHVVEDPAVVAHGEMAVGAAIGELRAGGLTAEADVCTPHDGGVAGRLVERAHASRAELVVMGSRGLGHLGGLFGRSVSHALLAKLELPLLIVPARAQLPSHGIRRVLVALRERDEAGPAADAVALLPAGLEVLVVHVPRAVAVHTGYEPGDSFLEVPETSDVVLRAARRRLRHAGIRATTHELARDGGVAEAITGLARGWDADLLVLGSRRLRQWEALIAGSTSHDVVRLSDRPVLIAGGEQLR